MNYAFNGRESLRKILRSKLECPKRWFLIKKVSLSCSVLMNSSSALIRTRKNDRQ
jgi:hypothetical protein